MQVLLAAVLAASVTLAVPAPAPASPSRSDHPRTLHVARAAQVAASRNLIDFNRRAGVFIAHGSAEIGPGNRLLDNEMGVWLSSDAHGTAVMDNSIEANVLDGVHLAGPRVGLVRANTIRANRKAAFSVAIRGSSRSFLAENQVAGNPVGERLRVEGHPTG